MAASDHTSKDQFAEMWEGDLSMEITHGAAALVKTRGGWSPSSDEHHIQAARHLLDRIDQAPVDTTVVFSGHSGRHVDLKPGDEFDIPLMSTSTSKKVAEGFAGSESPTLYRFSSHRNIPINEQERLVSGAYHVERVGHDGVIDLRYLERLPRTPQ